MANDMYNPTDNYERNFLLVKKFGSKPIVFIVPFLLLLHIIGIGYLSVTKHEFMEVTLIRLITSHINPDVEFGFFETSLMTASCLTSLFFIYGFLSFYFSCKNSSQDASPDFSLTIMYGWSMALIGVFALLFGLSFVFFILFLFRDPSNFESLGEKFNISPNELISYKPSIAIIIFIICAMFALLSWFFISQADFIKSIRMTLVQSVARNNGAHTFGVFSMSAAVAFLCIAGLMTFLYYCYKDALSGYGISMDSGYAYVSLAIAYIRGLVPFFVSACAFTFTEMVDEANTIGTIYYSHVDTLGEVEDPNMNRKKNKR